MPAFQGLRSGLTGLLWLVRAGGLREEMRRLDEFRLRVRSLEKRLGISAEVQDGTRETDSVESRQAGLTRQSACGDLRAFEARIYSQNGEDGILKEILRRIHRWRPRIVVIEYNASFPPPRRWVMKEDINYRWNGTNYHGASLASLTAPGQSKGYTLVATNSTGINAFFVRQDLASGGRFLDAARHYHYSPPAFGPHLGGHPPGHGPYVEVEANTACRHCRRHHRVPGGNEAWTPNKQIHGRAKNRFAGAEKSIYGISVRNTFSAGRAARWCRGSG